jgi:hypothetical protein
MNGPLQQSLEDRLATALMQAQDTLRALHPGRLPEREQQVQLYERDELLREWTKQREDQRAETAPTASRAIAVVVAATAVVILVHFAYLSFSTPSWFEQAQADCVRMERVFRSFEPEGIEAGAYLDRCMRQRGFEGAVP